MYERYVLRRPMFVIKMPKFGINWYSVFLVIRIACLFPMLIASLVQCRKDPNCLLRERDRKHPNTARTFGNELQFLELLFDTLILMFYVRKGMKEKDDIIERTYYIIGSTFFRIIVIVQSLYGNIQYVYVSAAVLCTVCDYVLCAILRIHNRRQLKDQLNWIILNLQEFFATDSSFKVMGKKLQREEFVPIDIPLRKVSSDASSCIEARDTVKGGVVFLRAELQYYVKMEEFKEMTAKRTRSKAKCIALEAKNSLLRSQRSNRKNNGLKTERQEDYSDDQGETSCTTSFHGKQYMSLAEFNRVVYRTKKILDREAKLREENDELMEEVQKKLQMERKEKMEETKEESGTPGTSKIDDVD